MKIAVLPGDDIGPEITSATLQILNAADDIYGLGLEYDEHEVGMAAHRREGTTLPASALQACLHADGVLLGPGGMTLYPPLADGGVNIPGTIRKRLNLFANLRPSRSRRNVQKAVPGLDCLIVRENTEGFYADRSLFEGYGEFRPTDDTAMSLRLITRSASTRIAHVAFAQAQKRRHHVTFVGKRHVLQMTDGLFFDEVSNVAKAYPDVELREMDADAIAAELYLKPDNFDVIVTSNMFGDILSNETSALAGGLGLSSALNVGDDHAAANAGHGSAPDIAGLGIANPTSLILSSALLIGWWGERTSNSALVHASTAITTAVDTVLEETSTRTRDLGGSASTADFTTAVKSALMRVAHAPV